MPLQTSTSQARSGRTTGSRSATGAKSKAKNAIRLLSDDHDEVEKLFSQFQKSKRDGSRKQELVRQICTALTVHAEIEEEIFYPAVREALGQKEEMLMDEAAIEHDSMKSLIEQIEEAGGDDEMLAAKMNVLCEYVMHHVKEEERKMFPKAKKTRLDMNELGAELLERKMELMEEQE
jgi:hemerythrin superfamily protein